MRLFRGLIFALPVAFAAGAGCGDSYEDSPAANDAGTAEDSALPQDTGRTALVTMTASPLQLNLVEGVPQKLALDVTRVPEFHEALQIALAGLPPKVSVTPAIALLGASETHAEFTLTRERGATPGDISFSAHAAGGAAEVTLLIHAFLAPISGGLDYAFGTEGVVATGVAASALALGPTGSAVVARATGSGLEVLRYDSSGKPDQTWGNAGIAAATAAIEPQAIKIGVEGNVLVGGRTGSAGIALVAFGTTGAWSTRFGDAGVVPVPPASSLYTLNQIAVRPNGKALLSVVAGNGSVPGVVQLRGELTVDSDFTPKFGLDFIRSAQSVEVTAENELYATVTGSRTGEGGLESGDFLARVDETGASGTFQSKLIVSNGADASLSRLRLAPDGSLIVFSNVITGMNTRVALRRFSHEGQPDSMFGSAGTATPTVGTSADYALDVAVLLDGSILVLTNSIDGNQQSLTVVRLRANGTIDTGFGDAGHVKLPIAQPNVGRIVVLLDGHIAVAATTQSGLALARLYP